MRTADFPCWSPLRRLALLALAVALFSPAGFAAEKKSWAEKRSAARASTAKTVPAPSPSPQPSRAPSPETETVVVERVELPPSASRAAFPGSSAQGRALELHGVVMGGTSRALPVIPQALSLEAAVGMAMGRNPALLRAKEEVERVRGQVIEVRAQALPQVGLSGVYQQTDRNLLSGQSGSAGTGGGSGVSGGGNSQTGAVSRSQPVPIPAPTPAPASGSSSLGGSGGSSIGGAGVASSSAGTVGGVSSLASPAGPQSPFVQNKNWLVTLQASQLVYDGGRAGAAIRIARMTRDASCFQLLDTINTTVAQVRTEFYQALVNRELIRVQEESVALLEEQWLDQKRRFEVGSVPRFNVLQAEVALANARPALIAARNNYHIAQLQLARTLGFDTRRVPARREPFELRGGLAIPAVGMDLSRALRVARERNPALEVARQNIGIGRETVRLQRAGYRPTVSVSGGYLAENRIDSTRLGDTLTGWFFGVQGSWAIFDGLATYGRVRQAKAQFAEALVSYEDAAQEVDLQVQEAWANLQQARETIEGGLKTVEQATEALRLARERLNAGAGTQLDVLNATVQLTQARTTELQARNSYNAALAEFDRVTATATRFAEGRVAEWRASRHLAPTRPIPPSSP